MRMWNVDTEKMCRQHLLGEHLECHMFFGVLRKGISIKGYIKNGLVETHNIQKRHDQLVKEMKRRGYRHNSKLKCIFPKSGNIDVKQNIEVLKERCPVCRERMEVK